ncbi:MAG: hypothetical protein QOG23_3758 [Blastocatellia bacterium]|jgi:hypothetical protein|nr:hypothetical protein [Blastocatellia bacterium]
MSKMISRIFNGRFMRTTTGLLIFGLLIATLTFSPKIITTVNATVPIPSGFQQIFSDTGIHVYQKNYTGGSPDYVTIVDLRSATICNLIGSSTSGSIGNMKVSRKLLGPSSTATNFWTDAMGQNTSTRKARVVVNGTFFSTNDYPTGLAFGLKANSLIVSYGYGLNEFPGLVRVLPFDSGRAASSIQNYAQSIFNTGSPDVIGCLDTTANKAPTVYQQRTFVGVRDDDRNGIYETVMFFSSSSATQSGARSVLTGFGAASQCMLDGGGSTGLVVDGKAKISTTRLLPHTIAMYAGK